MSSGSPLPGGPLHPEFRETIKDLAKQAQEEDRRAEEEAQKSKRRKSFSRFVGVGFFLIALEVSSLVVLSQYRPQVVVKHARPRSLVAPNTCNAVAFDTYWQVVEHIKDTDHPPASLSDLIPKYLDKLPSDPASGKPLEYSTDGTKFHLNCPGTRTAGR